MSHYHRLTISEVKKETDNSVILTFDVPQALKEDFKFIPGQYLTLIHQFNGEEVRRAYSICSSPASGKLQVGIKKVENGTFSKFANQNLAAGDSIDVMPPEGMFNLTTDHNKTANYVAFAAGSGITPIMSMVKAVLEEEPNSTFLLVYGNKSVSETMFYNTIEDLRKKYPQQLTVEYVFSKESREDARFGRIDKSIVNYFLKNKYKDTVFNGYYLCGPEPMINMISELLILDGISEKIVHFELFTTASEGELIEPHTGDTTITVTVDDETETFTMPQATSVLEASLDKGMDVPYSCQGGICSTCIARVIEGKVEMKQNQILTDGEIAEGLVLTCQAHPTTKVLIIDYDDV